MSTYFIRVLGGVVLAFTSAAAFAVDFGRTTGSFDVSPTGAATYSIPIWTPPGPNGLTPSISIDYDSQGDNGLVGVGWNLSAVSSIERCTRTKYQDTNGAPVDLSLNDRYCISGKRLRVATGAYGADHSTYYTEIADYSRVTAFGTAGFGPQYFVVEAKSGLKYEYGYTTDSRVFAGTSSPYATTPHRWMLNKVYDRSGNNLVISYYNGSGFAVPNAISWTPTYLGSSSYRYEAKFNYSTARTNDDSYLGNIAGFAVENRYRLENIQIKSAGNVVRKYRLSYDTSSVTSRSRLTSAKECADDAEANCFLPLTFGYQVGQAGVAIAATGGTAGSSVYYGKYDFDGDGKSDLLFVTGSTWKVAFSTGSAVGAPVDTGVSSSASFHVQRFLANSQDGLLVNVSGVWNYVGYNGSGFVTTSTGIAVPTGYVSGGEPRVTDNNGDGRGDIQWAMGGDVLLRLNVTPAGATVPSFGAAFTAASFSVGVGNVGVIANQTCSTERMCDINGDGRADLIVNITSVTGCGISGCTITTTKVHLLAWGSGYTQGTLTGPIGYRGMRFNADRCVDRLDNATPTLLISGCNNGAATTVTLPATVFMVFDWNGDRKDDLVVNNSGFFGVYLSTGSAASPFSTLITTTIPVPTGCTIKVFDLDGDGFDDIGCVGLSAPFAVSVLTHNGSGGFFLTQKPDLLNSIVDGFGVNISTSYASTAQSNYTRGTSTQWPLVDATDPIVVAALVTHSDGIGGTYNKTFSYFGARNNGERGEFAGFQRVNETDSRNGLIARIYYDQLFPVAGRVSQSELMQTNGVTTISRQVYTNTFTPLDTTTNNQRYFGYASGNVATQYELGGTSNGALLRTVTTANTFETTGGTLYDQTVTTIEPASGANGVYPGGSWVSHTSIPLADLINNSTTWCLSRPKKVKQENSHNLPSFGSLIMLTTNLSWDESFCRPTQMVAEPGSGTLQVTSDVAYDGFGNRTSTTITGIGMTPRTTTVTYSDATNTTGQFLLSATNALSQSSTVAWDYNLGVPTSATDPNGISTTWHYDLYGRRIRETRADATSTTWDYLQCTGCDPRVHMYVDQNVHQSGGTTFNRSIQYLDQFDRSVIEHQLRIDGYMNVTSRNFDALGNTQNEFFPYSSAGSAAGNATFGYDLLNRLVSTSRPISDTNATPQIANVFYEGLTTHFRDAQYKDTYQVNDAADQLVRSKDHDGNYQTFEYDSFGNQKRVTDSATNTLQTSSYNLRGMLTQRVDMDMGSWSFAPNALGETTSLTDAKSQTTTFEFDLLGRLKKRTEAEGVSNFTFGTSSAAKNIGRLASMDGPGYSEAYTYDSIGRLSNTQVTADTTYQVDYTYGITGAVDTVTYPTSTSSYRLKLKYDYQYGHLAAIKDFNVPATVFWAVDTMSPRNQVTREQLGNGLWTNRSFDAVTGWLKSIQTGASSSVQNLAYEWDLVGNLKKRKDTNQANLTEEFFYDNLYRLDYSQRNGTTNQDLSYDGLGNILSKLDVGTYTYDATKKHQVMSTSNGWSFGYDNNGNMTSGRGATMTWTSFNYPATITSGANTSAFSYAPDRQYWKQVSNYTSGGAATTIYVGGLLEKVTTSSGTDFRHMIRTGGSTIIVSRPTVGPNIVNYVTSDHLGSSSAITNSSGAVLVHSSFDAFGRRRGSNWSGSPSAGDWTAIASTTRRGYTDHSMLDNLELIHMNGRVHDPVLGRFLSADPYIMEPLNTQNYNRYSYVSNNPLSSTDPSGFKDKMVVTQPVVNECVPTWGGEIVVTGSSQKPNGSGGGSGSDFVAVGFSNGPRLNDRASSVMVSAPDSSADREMGQAASPDNTPIAITTATKPAPGIMEPQVEKPLEGVFVPLLEAAFYGLQYGLQHLNEVGKTCEDCITGSPDLLGGPAKLASGLNAARTVSRIKESPKLIRGAEAAGRSAQQSIDRLTDQLSRGNLNPGIGTKPIGRGISEARARDGARVYFRQAQDGTIEILGKSTKADQQSVINEVLRVFGN